jgi:integrase
MSIRLTDTVCRKLPVPATGYKISYDDEVAGFGLRVTANGARTFVLNYRRRGDHCQRQVKIGAFPTWTTQAARARAKEVRRAIDAGADPAGDLETLRAGPTLKEYAEEDWSKVLSVKRRASTLRTYRAQLDHDVYPALGTRNLAAITADDIAELHRKITLRGSPIAANRVIALLSGILRRAIEGKVRSGPNPVGDFVSRKGVLNKERQRDRFLSRDEAERLSAALAADPDQEAVAVLRLLWLTGARLGEVLAAEWSHFGDLKDRRWRKPGTITKSGDDHGVLLSADAVAVLQAIPRPIASLYLFPAIDKKGRPGHRKRIERAWNRIRATAGLPIGGPEGFRTHDVRHSFATIAIEHGAALPTVSKLLGHKSVRTTMRYAHATPGMMIDAAENVANAVRRSANAGKAVPLR